MIDKSSYQKQLKGWWSLLLLLLRLPLDLGLLELSAVGVGLHLPLPVLVFLELALLVKTSEEVLGIERVLCLSLQEFMLLLELPVLLLKLVCPLLLAHLLFLQFGELRSSAPSFRTYFQHMHALSIGRCTK